VSALGPVEEKADGTTRIVMTVEAASESGAQQAAMTAIANALAEMKLDVPASYVEARLGWRDALLVLDRGSDLRNRPRVKISTRERFEFGLPGGGMTFRNAAWYGLAEDALARLAKMPDSVSWAAFWAAFGDDVDYEP
jgi:hypothetical protein